MANPVISAYGLKSYYDPFGWSTAGKLMPFVIASGDSTAVFVQDLVSFTGESSIGEFPEMGYLPVVTQSAANSTQFAGVVAGFGVNPDNLTRIYHPGSTLQTVWVDVNPFAVFSILSTGTVVSGDIGQCAKITVGAGSTVTGLSGMALDHGNLTSSADQLKIVGVAPDSVLGTYTRLLVMVNQQFYKLTTGV